MLLRSVNKFIHGRDSTLKRELLNNLSECVKEIQYNNQFQENYTSVIGSGDASSALCNALEAVFLHGIKDTLFKKARNVLADTERKPSPDFWPLVLVVSHRQIVEQITSLQQITTPIGQCRAWLRAALNDCLLSSYLATLLRNISSIKPFYNRSALVCDTELLELVQKLVEGLESCITFEIPVNSSLLNDWPENILVSAGLWTQPVRDGAVSTALDVASTLVDESPAPQFHEPRPSQPTLGLGRALTIDEDEALKLILSEHPEGRIEKDNIPSPIVRPPSPIPPPFETFENVEAKDEVEDDSQNEIINSLDSINIKVGSSSDESEVIVSSLSEKVSVTDLFEEICPPITPSLVTEGDTDSLCSLAGIEDTPDLRDMVSAIHAELLTNATPESIVETEICAQPSSTREDPVLNQLGFELVSTPGSSFSPQEWIKLVRQLGSLSHELGLDSQNYRCAGCQDLLSGGTSLVKACAFTGQYYCNACTDTEALVIPARVVHNWDFRRYVVSKVASKFMLEIQHRPLLDVRALNPRIYNGVGDMRALRDLRLQLNLLRAYAATCRQRDRLVPELRRMLWPREYMYEAVHTYSPADLSNVPSGLLAASLARVVTFLREHVHGCWLCSQKGFICEVCRAPDALYPFDITGVYRCERCCGVFHSTCLNSSIACPKCERKARATIPKAQT